MSMHMSMSLSMLSYLHICQHKSTYNVHVNADVYVMCMFMQMVMSMLSFLNICQHTCRYVYLTSTYHVYAYVLNYNYVYAYVYLMCMSMSASMLSYLNIYQKNL
jgi:hypothetical protein